ncbi:MAG: glycoside hydrolase family 18 protein [Candidatus Sumerlaeaceae bacterium]|nr:glycoside hydrolase family 18 protein [Candidatus Sumerlaeaceae bacterium]
MYQFIRILSILGLGMVFLSPSQITAASAAVESAQRPIVLGYYPSWPTGLDPASIRYDLFTHLAHAFVTVTTEGALLRSGNLPSRELVSRAHHAGVKVLVSIGGADSGASMGPMALNDKSRRRFVSELVALVNEWSYDGVDLDWEFPQSEPERDALTTLARELRSALGRDRILASAQSGAAWTCRYVDMTALRDVLEWVAVMTYDMHGPWSSHAGHNAPMQVPRADRPECTSNSVEGFMRFWEERGQWPRERLLVGIPCYGRGFPVALYAPIPRGERRRYSREYVAFRDVEKLIGEGWKKQLDKDALVPWLASPDGEEFLSYDDEASARRKGEWARRHGYGGIFFWEISQDAVGAGRHPIIESARTGFFAKD